MNLPARRGERLVGLSDPRQNSVYAVQRLSSYAAQLIGDDFQQIRLVMMPTGSLPCVTTNR